MDGEWCNDGVMERKREDSTLCNSDISPPTDEKLSTELKFRDKDVWIWSMRKENKQLHLQRRVVLNMYKNKLKQKTNHPLSSRVMYDPDQDAARHFDKRGSFLKTQDVGSGETLSLLWILKHNYTTNVSCEGFTKYTESESLQQTLNWLLTEGLASCTTRQTK